MAGFRSLQTDPARCKQLHLQSLFSFRRLAPADDYLGSPFSTSFPLVSSGSLRFFWAFGPGFPLPPLSSPRFRFPFVPLPLSSGYSASCSSFQPSIGSASQWLSQRPGFSFRPSLIFPVPHDWFPVRAPRFCLFSSPVCSLSLFPASLPQPFHRCSRFLPLLPLLSPVSSMRPFTPVPPSFVSSAVLPLRSRPFRTPLLGLCFFLSLLQASASQELPLCRPVLRFPFGPLLPFRPSLPAFVSSGSPGRLPTFFPLSVLSGGSFSSFVPLPAVPFRFLWSPSLRIRYSVPLLFLSPPHNFTSQRLRCALAFPLGFRPSP